MRDRTQYFMDNGILDGVTIKGAWRDRAECAKADPAIFYPTKGNQTLLARAVCDTCPVVQECGSWAIGNETSGVWGGMSETEVTAVRAHLGVTIHGGN